MLIRSGLIQNFGHIDEATFTQHWREVHGPLAAKLPNLRGYVQNHIVVRGRARHAGRVHRIDGISQLWFEGVEAMTAGMTSPEQDACVADISGFLQSVTLAIQDQGIWVEHGDRSAAASEKLLAVYIGEGTAFDVAADIEDTIAGGDFTPARYRINPILGRNFIVDPSIARSDAPLLAVLEAYFVDDDARQEAIRSDALDRASRLAPAAVLAVKPYTFISPPA